jgi:hypothetical protein
MSVQSDPEGCQSIVLTAAVRVAHSPKGWTDGGIRRLWIEDFDKKTCDKANGRARLLLVDGHNSHYTKEFLEYARDNNIHVLCYPAHTTHVYQGLEDVIFGLLKHYWTQERDQFESSNKWSITKANFVAIYTSAHQKALMPDNIRAAFKKTGAWPFNPEVVTKDMMAPSLKTSAIAQLLLPQASPVRAISGAIRQYQIERHGMTLAPANPTSNPLSASHSTPSGWQQAAQDAAEGLASTSVSFLVTETPLTSVNHLLTHILTPLTPTRKRKHQLLDMEPKNDTERAYQDALCESYAREDFLKATLTGMQSTVVLQSMFCDRLSGQLAA